jgi:hypothetical protein
VFKRDETVIFGRAPDYTRRGNGRQRNFMAPMKSFDPTEFMRRLRSMLSEWQAVLRSVCQVIGLK